MMQEIDKVKFKHVVVPVVAVNLNIVQLMQLMPGNAAILTTFLKKDGLRSCQVVFSRSKIIPDELMQS